MYSSMDLKSHLNQNNQAETINYIDNTILKKSKTPAVGMGPNQRINRGIKFAERQKEDHELDSNESK